MQVVVAWIWWASMGVACFIAWIVTGILDRKREQRLMDIAKCHDPEFDWEGLSMNQNTDSDYTEALKKLDEEFPGLI